jgi:hypothetical protein
MSGPIPDMATNAIQAMAEVRNRPRVLTIRSQLYERDNILVEVEDSGIGLDPTGVDHGPVDFQINCCGTWRPSMGLAEGWLRGNL